MFIGIKMTPAKSGGPPQPEVFYCGLDNAALRREHRALVSKNDKGLSRFYSISHPMMAPLQNVEHSTEEHPDELAARERRAKLASAEHKTETQAALPEVETAAKSRAKK